ncbi:MAG: hypothetical protein SFU98_14300 [Leptospiraceae bacterium]|nr:hypothetical protein [Leptospiraceae bacterium]
MNWKKPAFILIAFVTLFVVFFFIDEREEDLSEVNFWKIEPDEIRYIPAEEPNDEFKDFRRETITMFRKSKGLKEQPVFTIRVKDDKGFESIFEAGYQVKNLFTELSVIKTKTMTNETPDLLGKFLINEKGSPKIELYSSDKLLKRMILGKEDKSVRFFASEKFIISSASYVFNKLKKDGGVLREKQLIFAGEARMQKVEFVSKEVNLVLENRSANDMQVNQQVWLKTSNKKAKVNPNSSSRMDGSLKGLMVELYPDDKDGEGFAKSLEETNKESNSELNITLANGVKYSIKFFDRVEKKGQFYYPIIKSIEKEFIESPAYLKENLFISLLETLKTIRDEPEWIEPKR